MLLSEKQFRKILELSVFVLFLYTPFLCSKILATSRASLFKMTVSNVLTLWIVALIMYGSVNGYIRKIKIPRAFILFLLYLFYTLILYFFRGNLIANIYEFNKLALFVLIILFFQFVDLRKMLTLFHFIFFLVLLYGFLQSVGVDIIEWGSYSRIFSTFGNPNFYSPYVLLFLPLYVVLLYRERKVYYAILLFLALWNIYFARTRGVYLGTMFILGAFILFELLRKFRVKLEVLLYIVGVVMLIFLLYTTYVHGENFSFIAKFKGTVRQRVLIWQGALRISDMDKLFGFGYGSFKRYYPHYASMFFVLNEGDPNVMPSYAHNEYVEQIFEVGIIGTAIFLLIFLSPIYFRIKRWLEGKENYIYYAMALGLLAVLVQNTFGVNMRYATTSTYLFLLFGYVASYDYVYFDLSGIKRPEIFYALAVLAILGAAYSVVPIISSTFEQAGNEYDINKNPDNSFEMYRRAYQVSRRNDVALYKMGYYFHKHRGQSFKSLYYYKTLLKFAPYYPEVRYTVGTIYYTMKRHEYAYDILKKDIEDIYYNAKSHNNLGNVYSEFDKWKYAIHHYKCAYYIDPNLALAYVNAGVVYLEKGFHDEAIEELTKALKVSPRYGYAWLLLSRAYQKKGDTEKYEYALKQAQLYGGTQEKKRLANAYNEEGKRYFNNRDFAKALEYFKKALRLFPDEAKYYNNAGLCYYHLKQYEQAEEYYKNGLRYAPKDKLLLQNLALLYSVLQRYDDEIKVYEKIYRYYSDTQARQSLLIRYRNQGARLFNAGKRKEVIPYWEKYKELGGNEANILGMLEKLKQQYR